MKYAGDAHALIQGEAFSYVYPPRDKPRLPPTDGRSVALSILRKYLAELIFHLPKDGNISANEGEGGVTSSFRICEDSIFTETSDAFQEAALPSVAFTPAKGDYNAIGLGIGYTEETRDLYGEGTVQIWLSEYTETFTMEVWAPTKAMRRALVAGIEIAMTPVEFMYGLRFRMPEYWNETVCFTLTSRTNIDDTEAQKGRWRAHFEVEMRFNVVAQVLYEDIVPLVSTETDGAA